MFGLSRITRLFIFATLAILIPTLYFLYPTRNDATWNEIEAGGIDSPHWRAPITPNIQNEQHLNQDVVDGGGGRTGQSHVEGDVSSDLQDENVVAGDSTIGSSSGITPSHLEDEEPRMGPADDVTGKELNLQGGTIMPKMENETAKAELGRAAWRVLHLMTLRYPDKPTEDDRTALKSYFHLFSRLYPCGECAQEFQALLKQYPPQTSSRKTASLWLCHVHNQVNLRLGKPEFDCLTLDETYDCGCGPEGETSGTSAMPTDTKPLFTGAVLKNKEEEDEETKRSSSTNEGKSTDDVVTTSVRRMMRKAEDSAETAKAVGRAEQWGDVAEER